MAKEEREMIQDMENLITIDMEQTINKMPVPRCCFEPKGMGLVEVTQPNPNQTHRQEGGTNNQVHPWNPIATKKVLP